MRLPLVGRQSADATAAPPHPAWGSPKRWITDTGLEWLKWLGFTAMVVDHVGTFWLVGGTVAPEQGPLTDVMYGIGRIAFPLFGLAFGLNLARVIDSAQPVPRSRKMGWRLLVAAMLAQWPVQQVQQAWLPLDVLFLFLVAFALVIAWQRAAQANGISRWGLYLGAAALAYAATPWVDGHLPGLLLVLAAYAWGRSGAAWGAAAFVAALAFLAHIFAAWEALFALPAVVLIGRIRLTLPRVPGLLYVLYPLHLWVLWAIYLR